MTALFVLGLVFVFVGTVLAAFFAVLALILKKKSAGGWIFAIGMLMFNAGIIASGVAMTIISLVTGA